MSLLHHTFVPARPYELLANVRDYMTTWPSQESLVSSSGASQVYMGTWDLDIFDSSIDLLSCTVYAVIRSTFDVIPDISNVIVPVCFDGRLLLRDDLSALVSMLTVCKLCPFTRKASRSSIRDVIDKTAAISSCSFDNVINYYVFAHISTEEEFRLLFAQGGDGLQTLEVNGSRSHESHQLCNIYLFPGLKRCRIELVMWRASEVWLHQFEEYLMKVTAESSEQTGSWSHKVTSSPISSILDSSVDTHNTAIDADAPLMQQGLTSIAALRLSSQ